MHGPLLTKQLCSFCSVLAPHTSEPVPRVAPRLQQAGGRGVEAGAPTPPPPRPRGHSCSCTSKPVRRLPTERERMRDGTA